MSDVEFERRVSAALRRDLPADARAKARIMERVRASARDLPRRPASPFGRGARHSIVGLALAAGVGSVTTLSSLLPPTGAGGATPTGVIGDTVVGTLRDTLRLVRLMFDDPVTRQLIETRSAFVVDATRWVPDPGAERVRADDGRLHSLLRVARTTN